MLQRYSRFITRHPLWVLMALGLATLVAVSALVDLRTGQLRLSIDTSFEQLLPAHNENRTFYDRVRKLFGNDETLLLVIHRPGGVFTTEVLQRISDLTQRVEKVNGVSSVLSLATAPNMEGVDGDLVIAPLYETPPRDAAALELIRRKAFDNPLFLGSLINPAGDTTSLVIQLLDLPEAEFTRLQTTEILPAWLVRWLDLPEPALAELGVDRQIQQLGREVFGDEAQTWLIGSAHVKAETTRMLIDDLTLVIPLALLLIAVVALISFRTLRGVLLPLSAIGVSVLWTLGAMVSIDPHLNLVTVSVPMLLLVIGFAYAVHVVSCYYNAIEEGPGAQGGSAAFRGLFVVLLPTLLTSLTTMAGFFSLISNPLSAVRQFGLYGGIGVGFAGLAAITLVPAVLQLLPEPRAKGRLAHEEHGVFDRWMGRLGDFDVKHATGIFVAVAAISLLSLAAIPRIEVNSTMVSNFPERSDVRVAVEAVNEHLGGAGQINVVLETAYPKGFTEPSLLKQLDDLETWLRAQPTITGVTSILDYIKLIHRGFNDNDPAQYKIPASRNLVAQLLFFGGSDETKRFVDSQYQVANVLVRTTALDSADLGDVVKKIEARLTELEDPLQGRVTGNLVLIAKTNDEIAFGQAISVTSAFWSIFAIMALLFMSVRVGAIAMIPNIFPVLVYFGILGWASGLGLTLNVTTGLVASIVLGIAVDDTIHFLSSFNRFAREHASEQAGVRRTLMHVGRPVTYTSFALCAGFAVLSLSQLRQQADFGWLAAATLIVAWVSDVVFTPAIAARLRIVTLWDVISLDLGENPQEAIPLFRGFSPWQARIVALMTEIVERKQGDRLIQLGQKSDGMYVVVDGQLQSSFERDGTSVPLNRHGRGDVLGEVGLFRGERTANVDCESDVRALRFDQENLARLQRRYPRTASKLMYNLSEVLANRLVGATARVH